VRLSANHKLAILLVLIAIPTGIMAWKKLREVDEDGALEHYGREQSRLHAFKTLEGQKAAALADVRARAHKLTLGELFAAGEPAMPGLLFDGLPLTERWTADADMQRRFDGFHTDTDGSVTVTPDEIIVYVPGHDAGDDLRAAATTAWQPGDLDHWLDRTAHMRASITVRPDGAFLYFQRAITLDQLFPADAATDSELWPALGAPADFVPPLGAHAEPLGHGFTGFTYVLPSIDWTFQDSVHVEVLTAHDEVTKLFIRTGARTDSEIASIQDALSSRYGGSAAKGLTLVTTMTNQGLQVELSRKDK
jgi:hypothetical protein